MILLTSGAAVSQDYDAGNAAYARGDYAAALSEWIPLAEKGDQRAQNALGILYELGQGVVQNYRESLRWRRLAADQGNPGAQYSVGDAYEEGTLIIQDYTEAMRWYRLSAEQGYTVAHYKLGMVFHYGTIAPRNLSLAHMWYNISCVEGINSTCEHRDEVAKEMSSSAISEAQRRALICIESNFKDCDWE